MIEFEPRNIDAVNLVAKARAAIDGRLSLDSEEIDKVLCYIFSNRHKEFVNLTGYPKVTDALLAASVVQRHSGKRNFTVHRDFVSHDARFQTKNVEPLFKFPLISKSGTYYTNSEDCLSLSWNDVSKVNSRDAYLLQVEDMGKTLAAWADGHKPSVRFESIPYERQDEEAASQYVEQLLAYTKMKCIPMVQVQDGLVVADCVKALRFVDSTTTRFMNDATKKFAVRTFDKHGRQAIRPGSY